MEKINFKMPILGRRKKSYEFELLGLGCSPAVEHMPHNQEIVGLNPAGCWAFSSSSNFPTLLHQWSVLKHAPQGGASLTVRYERKMDA